MTGASENGYIVRLRAQVMYHDEGTGGWMALGGGGLADIIIGKRVALSPATAEGDFDGEGDEASSAEPAPQQEFYIYGQRLSDNSIVLECTIKKDFQYKKIMPTFHHWMADAKRFGLTFQTAADARAFDRGIRIAVKEVMDDLWGTWSSIYNYEKHYSVVPIEDEEELNIFECIDLPGDSRTFTGGQNGSRNPEAAASSAGGPGGVHLRSPPGDMTQTPILYAITLPNHPLSESVKQYDAQYEEKLSSDDDHEKTRHLSIMQESSYGGGSSSEKSSPNMEPSLLKRDSASKNKHYKSQPLPEKKTSGTYQERLRCRYCDEWYLESANRAGACKYGPDRFRSCVDAVSCIKCAKGMVYHCLSDSEDEFEMRPCACAPVDRACVKRWSALALLSAVVPCLCCYLPLRCVHRSARAVNLAGGRHAPHTLR